MENLKELFAEKNEMVKKGQIVEIAEKYFADDAVTIEFSGERTGSRTELVEKMKVFLPAIKKVNGITLHYAAIADNVSFAEFTFDFDMQDGSKVFWHEIIRSIWKDGKITEEQYFKS